MINTTTQKIDDNQIKVTKEETTSTENTFTYEYLLSQKEAIQKQKDRDNEARDKELDEINALLAECDKLNITVKVEPIIEPII